MKYFWAVTICIFLFALTVLSRLYGSAEPAVVVSILTMAGGVLLFVPKIGGEWERVAFWLSVVAGALWAGVAGYYEIILGDMTKDADFFFLVATNWTAPDHVYAKWGISESTGPIILWHYAYEFFRSIGFEAERYIGVGVNIVLAAFTSVITIKSLRTMGFNDRPRLMMASILFAMCPIFFGYSNRYICAMRRRCFA